MPRPIWQKAPPTLEFRALSPTSFRLWMACCSHSSSMAKWLRCSWSSCWLWDNPRSAFSILETEVPRLFPRLAFLPCSACSQALSSLQRLPGFAGLFSVFFSTISSQMSSFSESLYGEWLNSFCFGFGIFSAFQD